jgi:serine/threonine protein kinase/regulation of enolase protein 1 (concanavalin A-like superfamily)
MLQPRTILDNKYQIEAVIGRGGFGHVYRARERLTGETVAIKELVPSFVDDREMVQRFIQEARLTLRLSHPHIVRTYGIFQDRGTYYLAMEFLSGGSLADRVERGPLPIAEAVRVAAELCKALEQAHQLEITHCDIKPANVLFDEQGRVHLTDFGIAHVSAELTTRHVVTASGTTMGTVRYMAPEQLEGVRDDPRVDVYAVGAVLYEMLAGRPYLDFETETSIAAQLRNAQRIQSERPRPLRAVNPAVPEWLTGVVNQALRKAPEDRFGTAKQLRDALGRAPDLRAAPQGPPAPAAPGDGWIARGAGWLKDLPVAAALTVAVAMVALLACGAIGLWMIRDAGRSSPRTPTVTLKLTDLATAPALTSSPAPQSADLTGTSRSDEAQLALETPSEIPLSDSDDDGVPDDQDRCPDLPGSQELGGCPDSDDDGVPDPQDRCPDSFGSPEHAGCPVQESTEPSPTATTKPTSPTAASNSFDDEFNSPELDARWSWVREDRSHWTLTDRPGYLRITTQRGDIYAGANNLRNLLLQQVPEGDFEVTTLISVQPQTHAQQAGLVVYQDDDNFVRLTRGFMFSDNQVEFLLEQEGNPTAQSAEVAASTLYLRISRQGAVYEGSYSLDNASWVTVGEYRIASLHQPQVGIGGWNGDLDAPEVPADFDFFHVTSAPATTVTRGVIGDCWADVVIGQPDFSQITPNEVVGYRLFNPGGVYVDRSVQPNRVYVYDAGNNRVLGLSHLGVCSGGAREGQNCTTNADCGGSGCRMVERRPADLVLGQPSFNASACNGDSGLQNYPDIPDARADTLCGMLVTGVSTLESGSGATLATDRDGNLYVPDVYNHRVLRYDDPFAHDSAADHVWGQADFSGNDCNRGASYNHPDNKSRHGLG